MELSQSIKTKIKAWEGCRLAAYRCPSGVPTIGYGHTGADVYLGLTISQERAEKLFDADIARFARHVEKLLSGISLTGNQFDALVSLAYNIGAGAFELSTLLSKVRRDPNDHTIRAEFAKGVHGGGKVLPGLVKRRTAEANHYFGQI